MKVLLWAFLVTSLILFVVLNQAHAVVHENQVSSSSLKDVKNFKRVEIPGHQRLFQSKGYQTNNKNKQYRSTTKHFLKYQHGVPTEDNRHHRHKKASLMKRNDPNTEHGKNNHHENRFNDDVTAPDEDRISERKKGKLDNVPEKIDLSILQKIPEILRRRRILDKDIKSKPKLNSILEKLHELRMNELHYLEYTFTKLLEVYSNTIDNTHYSLRNRKMKQISDENENAKNTQDGISNKGLEKTTNPEEKKRKEEVYEDENMDLVQVLSEEQVQVLEDQWSSAMDGIQLTAVQINTGLKELEEWKKEIISKKKKPSAKSNKSSGNSVKNGSTVNELDADNSENDVNGHHRLHEGGSHEHSKILESNSKKVNSKSGINDDDGGDDDDNDEGSSNALVDGVLESVSKVADKLEKELQKNTSDFKNLQKEEGASLQTVVKVASESREDKEEEKRSGKDTKGSQKKVSVSERKSAAAMLIDADNNQYVMAKANDITSHFEDVRLARDLVVLILSCFLGSLITHLLDLPAFFGYLGVGMVLGQYDLLQAPIQIETLGRSLGITFMMFILGMEFSISKIRRVWKVSIFGCLLLLVGTFFLLFFFGNRMDVRAAKPDVLFHHSIVISVSVFLSSTTVALQCMPASEQETTYGRSIIGILVAQDLLLGLFLSILPALEKPGSEMVISILQVLFRFLIFLLSSALLYFPLRSLGWFLQKKSSHELTLLFSIGVCIAYVTYGEYWKLSAEISAFIAGVVLSAVLSRHNEEMALETVTPLRYFFSALFFASVGVHIYPDFLWDEFSVLLLLTLTFMALKSLLTWFIMRFLCRCNQQASLMIAGGLCQMSEFSFIFASKAKSNGLITREVYYLILGTASMSILLSPIVWKALSWCKLRKEEKHSGRYRAHSRTQSNSIFSNLESATKEVKD